MRILLASLTFLIIATLLLLTAPAAIYLQVQAQPITSSALGGPGTILLTTFPNGTSKVTWVNGTTLQFLNGVGVLIIDPSVLSAASSSAYVSNTNVVNRIYQAIAVAIGITIPPPLLPQPNNTIPIPPPSNQTEPEGPDEQCIFDPSLPHCAADPEVGCPDGFFTNEDDQCVPTHTRCPEGYHSHEDDESGRCIPDSIPCQPGYIMNPGFPSCDIKEFVCLEFPEIEACQQAEGPGPIPESELEPEPMDGPVEDGEGVIGNDDGGSQEVNDQGNGDQDEDGEE